MEPTVRSESDGSTAHAGVGRTMVVVAGFLLLGAVGLLVLVSGLIMPIWAVLALGAVWLVAVAVAIRWRSRPSIVLSVPFAMLGIWLATAWLGDRFLDWTA